MTKSDMVMGGIVIAIICIMAIVIYFEVQQDFRVDPTENRTITIVDKYEYSLKVIDQNDNIYVIRSTDDYMRLHPQRTYNVVIGNGIYKVFYPFATSEYQYIKEIVGEVK